MKKLSILILFLLCLNSLIYSQVPEQDNLRLQSNKLSRGNYVFKPVPLESPVSEGIVITGWGVPAYTFSNFATGLASSYEHSYQIAYPLTVAGNKTGYTLVFFGPHDKIPYSVEVENGKTTFYIPFSLHDNFKSKFEQALTLRKKVTVTLKMEVNGYREASWKFN